MALIVIVINHLISHIIIYFHIYIYIYYLLSLWISLYSKYFGYLHSEPGWFTTVVWYHLGQPRF
jgi:hypothetical protein